MQNGVLNFAAYGVGGRCFDASGSQSRCTVPSPTSHVDVRDVLGAHAVLRQPDRAIDERLRHRAARVRLERHVLRHPASAESVERAARSWRGTEGANAR